MLRSSEAARGINAVVSDHAQVYVDVGAASAEEVTQMGLRIGDPWVWLSELEPMTNPDRLVG